MELAVTLETCLKEREEFLTMLEVTLIQYGGLNQVRCLFLDLPFVVSLVLSPAFSVVSDLPWLLVLIVVSEFFPTYFSVSL